MARLEDLRRRLPVVESLPAPKGRRHLPLKRGEAPTPSLAVWEITLACDHRCLHCGPRAGKARPDELSTEECLRLVADLAALGVGEVTLIGGEAYMRNDFILVVRAIREHGMACTMTTGGLGLTRARAEAAAEAGLSAVSVSIDGMRDNHDRVRDKEGSWDAAFRALDNAKAAGLKIACNTQINSRSHADLPALLERLADKGIYAWQLQITMPHGSAADHADLIIQPYMFPQLFDDLSTIADRCRELGVTIWPGNNLGYFGPYEHQLRRFQKSRGHWVGCNAGAATIGIESNGMIKSCPSVGGPTNIGGSWREHGLRELWDRAPEITYIRDRTLDDLWGYCRECYYADVCRAGCTAATEPLLGRPGNNPFCHHRALEMDRMGMRERIEQVRGAPGLPFDNGLFRLIREPKDPEERARTGPVHVDQPRISRLVEPLGAGRPVDLDDPRS